MRKQKSNQAKQRRVALDALLHEMNQRLHAWANYPAYNMTHRGHRLPDPVPKDLNR